MTQPFFKQGLASCLLLLFCLIGSQMNAQIVTFQDTIFRQALTANPSIDLNDDGLIQVSEANAYTGMVDVNSLGISDLSGIEAFTSMYSLDCSNNLLTGMNISTCVDLQALDCHDNDLLSLDLSYQTLLSDLDCGGNQLSTLDLSNNPAITILYCYDNQLTSLDLSPLGNLNYLYCQTNLLNSFNLSSNTFLSYVDCSNNSISTIIVGMKPYLTEFNCSNNNLSTVDISNCPELNIFSCETNNISTLDFTGNSLITQFNVSENVLTALNCSNLNGLTTVNCYNNQITNLNLNSNYLLTHLNCSNNSLTDLNIQNGNNHNLTTFAATGNAGLTCILVDNPSFMNTNWSAGKDAGASFTTCCSGGDVNFADPNLENAIIALYPSIDNDINGSISCAEAAAYMGSLNVSGQLINSMVGIEAFVNIIDLYCENNNLSSLNLSSNLNLTLVNCRTNSINNLQLGANPYLADIDCGANQLSTLNVSQLPALYYLICDNNNLTNINLSGNPLMEVLYCYNNYFTSFDFTANPLLISLYCYANQITNLDLSALNMIYLNCSNNNLADLNLQNGNNTNLLDFNALNNPALNCIKVDDPIFMDANWSAAKDAWATYSLVCPLPCVVNIPDPNFKAALVANLTINTNADSEIQCSEASAYNGQIIVDGLGISDLTGIEAFTNIYDINCSNNNLTTINISANTQITLLTCNQNSLSNLDLSNNTLLTNLECKNNLLSSLDVSNNLQLIQIRADNNSISSLSVSNNTLLNEIALPYNQLSWIDLSNNPLIESLDFTGNQLSTLDLSTHSLLTSLVVSNNLLSSLNIQNGNNTNITQILALNNPSLSCIKVDDVAYSIANWNGYVDPVSAFSTNCSLLADFTADVTTLCENGTVNFTDLSAGTTGLTTYLWDFGDSQSSNVVGDVSHVYSTAGTYTVSLTISEGFPNTKTISNYITVNPIPAAPVLSITDNCGSSEVTAAGVVGTLVWSDAGSGNPRTIVGGTLTATQDLAGCVSAISNPVTSVPLIIPVTSVISGNATPNCSETGVAFSVVLTTGSNYSWSVPAGSTITNGATGPENNSITVDFGVTNGNVSVIETNASGCTGTVQNFPISLQGCALAANFTADVTTVCEGATVTFTDLSTGTTGSTTYTWDFGVGANPPTATGAGPHAVVYSNAGQATVVLSVTDGTTSVQTLNNYITINALPTVANIGNDSTQCGGSILLNANISGPGITYLWSNGVTTQNNVVNVSGNYFVELTNICGTVMSNSVQITINPLPAPAVITANGSTIFCPGGNVVLSSSYPTGNYWNTGSNNNSITVSTPGIYNLTYIDALGCLAASNSISVNYAAANIPVAFNAFSTLVTDSNLTALFNNLTPNISQYNFVWYFGDGTMLPSNAASVTHSYAYNGVYSVSLLAYDQLNCIDTLTQFNYLTANYNGGTACNHTANILPSGNISACAGSTIPLNVSTNAGAGVTFQWNRNGVIIGGATQPNYTVNQNGNYTVTVFNSSGCPITSSTVQIDFNQTAGSPPVISSTGLIEPCGVGSATLTASGSFSGFLWSTGQTGPSIVVSQGGTYTVTGQSVTCDVVSAPFLISGSNAPVPSICMITVDPVINKNVLVWEKPVSNNIANFIIMREDTANAGVYSQVGVTAYTDSSKYIDMTSYANLTSYRYKVAVEDTCGGITIASNFFRTLFLDVQMGNSILHRQLNWNEFQDQTQVIDYNLIYRETTPNTYALIDSVPSFQTWYYDQSITQLSDTGKKYMIGYRLDSGCDVTRAARRRCNSNSAGHERILFGGVGLKDYNFVKFDYDIVPNPNNGLFNIRFTGTPDENLRVKAIDMLGNELINLPLQNIRNNPIDMRWIAPGVYYIQIGNRGKRVIIK